MLYSRGAIPRASQEATGNSFKIMPQKLLKQEKYLRLANVGIAHTCSREL